MKPDTDFYKVDVILRVRVRSPEDLDDFTLRSVAVSAIPASRTENSVTMPGLKWPCAVQITDIQAKVVDQ